MNKTICDMCGYETRYTLTVQGKKITGFTKNEKPATEVAD